MNKADTPTHPATKDQMEPEVQIYDIVILFSGGADSVLMMELAKFMKLRPMCVLVDYEQLHVGELVYAKSYLKKARVPYRLIKLHDLQIQSGLTGAGERGRFDGVHEMHVPSRNLMFVGIAASIAEDLDVDTIWYGADFSDYINKFPDCMQDWFGKLNEVLAINGPKPIKLEAPLAGLTKETILKVLVNNGITDGDMFTGYGDL